MKILVVDDSKAMRMIVLSTLRKAGFGEHAYSEANNGKEALEQISKDTPELILCDWNMPEMSGIQLITELNKMLREKTLEKIPKFVFITSESTETMQDKAKEQGVTGFITKPFREETFKKVLGEIIL